MVTRAAGLALLVLVPSLARGQLPEAEAAFGRGDYRTARAGYERALAQDSTNVRALFRLAVLDSWEGQLARSLARFAALRHLEPADADIMVAHARVLSWAGKNRESERLFDSVLARDPDRVDALAGRARAVAWAGDLDRAERLWRSAADLHPDDAETLLGLAQTLWWKGQPALAETFITRARTLAPEDRTARDLERLVRAALRPEVATTTDYAHDSDENVFFLQEGTYTTSLTNGLRGTVHAGWRRATDPARTGTSAGAGGYVIAALGKGAVLRAGFGARRLAPGNGALPTRSPFTAQLGIGLRPARYASVSLGYSRSTFDETARLIETGYFLDGLDVSVDVSPTPFVSLSGGGGVTWLSDGNRRIGGIVAVLATPARGLQVGGVARTMSYRWNRGHGYFAPIPFSVLEVRTVWTWRRERWGIRTDGGVGAQHIGPNGDTQSEWHLGLQLSRGWSANSEVALVGSITNSAASSQSGAPQFTYWTVGLRLRQGL